MVGMFACLGLRSAARPRLTLVLVALFVVVAGVVGGPVAGRLSADGGFAPGDAESVRAADQLAQATGREGDDGILLLVRGPAGGVEARAAAAAAALRAVDGIATARGPAAISADGERALVTAALRDGSDADAVVDDVQAAFADDKAVTVGGSELANRQIGETVSSDLGRAELIAFPLLLLLSLLFFRGRAALLPLVVGVTTVLGTFVVLSAVNLAYGLNVFALNLVIGLGLGLAIDYTLFLVTRFREQLEAGDDVRPALATTMRTAGRTVAFSAATVAVALVTLTVFPQGFAKSMGIAGASVAIVAAVAALAVSPALLALWGRKLLRRDGRAASAAEGRWHRLAHAVMRRPGLVAAVTAAVMLAAALPALNVTWSPVDATAIPTSQSSRVVSDSLARDFGGIGRAPVTVAVTAPRSAGAEVAAYARRLGRIPAVQAVSRPQALSRDVWRVELTVPGDPAGPRAQDVVAAARDTRAPFATAVTGPAAGFVDQQAAIGARLLPAVLLLAALTFVVLWLMTGSVVLPLKAILMNALTVGAALSPLVLIYQGGHLEGLLGYVSNGGVEPTDFLVTAALIFALSTDYGVFLLGRIKEARDSGLGEREAVATGLARTGRVVTAAAVLLAVAIGAFSTSSVPFIQQVGIATATGVLLDAFVVRSLLVPSLMALLGRWNWWSPRSLRRLHDRVGLREHGMARASGA